MGDELYKRNVIQVLVAKRMNTVGGVGRLVDLFAWLISPKVFAMGLGKSVQCKSSFTCSRIAVA